MTLQVGDHFDHYQIDGYVAQGGMGNIYRAADLLNGREVALKIPHRAVLNDPVWTERFEREVEVTSKLRHPAIQQGLGFGNYNGTPYLATELIEGQALRSLMEAEGRLPVPEAVDLIRKIADGVAYCHEHGVIHRDLKPENILIKAHMQPVILDFGLALTKTAKRVTNPDMNSGTPDYIAPEQLEGRRGDEHSDLYAIGTIFYEMLMGKTPFTGDTMMAVMAQHLNGDIPTIDRSDVSPQLAAIIQRCLQRQPEDRYPSVRAFLHDLDHPETVDISILNKDTGKGTKPWWRRLIPAVLLLALAPVLLQRLAVS